MTVFFVGPLPPPVNGFSVMNQSMLSNLSQRTETFLFNRAPDTGAHGIRGMLQRIFSTITQLGAFARKLQSSRRRVLYLAVSGGWGQAFDVVYCFIARLAGADIFFHHHSFSYVNQRARLTSLLFFISKNARHIVLCECMRKMLAARYNLQPANVMVMSNAALLSAVKPELPSLVAQQTRRVSIGFLSNITEEKGIFELFDALDALTTRGIAFIVTIAGPVDEKIRARFEARLSTFATAEYIGSVYGERKQAFLSSLDLLLFPTKYPNEAEPVTLLEALQHGVYIVAADRGCIRGMVPPMSGVVVPISQFIEAAVEAVKIKSLLSPLGSAQLRRSIMDANITQLTKERKTMSLILELICDDR